MAAGDYAFGTRNLHDGTNYLVTDCKPPAVPVRLLSYPLGRYEGSAVSDAQYGEAEATVRLVCFSTTQTLAETALDNLLRDLYDGEQNLKLGYVDERYWRARLTGPPSILRVNPLGITVELTFQTSTAFAWAAAPQHVDNDGALSLVSGNHYSKSFAVTVLGNAPSRPLFTITVPGGGPYGMTQIYVLNTTLPGDPAIFVNRAWQANDFLQIDSYDFTVKIFGVSWDSFGSFFVLDPREGATNTIEVHAIATSTPTLLVDVDWTPRYYA